MMMMSDEQQPSRPFIPDTGRPLYTSQHLPPAWLAPAIRDPHLKTLAGVVVVVVEATRASITKPHGLLGRRGVTNPTQISTARENPPSLLSLGLSLPPVTYSHNY